MGLFKGAKPVNSAKAVNNGAKPDSPSIRGQEHLWAAVRHMRANYAELDHRVDILERARKSEAVKQSREKKAGSSEPAQSIVVREGQPIRW